MASFNEQMVFRYRNQYSKKLHTSRAAAASFTEGNSCSFQRISHISRVRGELLRSGCSILNAVLNDFRTVRATCPTLSEHRDMGKEVSSKNSTVSSRQGSIHSERWRARSEPPWRGSTLARDGGVLPQNPRQGGNQGYIELPRSSCCGLLACSPKAPVEFPAEQQSQRTHRLPRRSALHRSSVPPPSDCGVSALYYILLIQTELTEVGTGPELFA